MLRLALAQLGDLAREAVLMFAIGFDDCFDRRKLRRVLPLLPATYAELDALAPWREGRWPTRVRCMTDEEIAEGRSRGAGHGYTVVPGDDVWVNPRMHWQSVWLVLVHENLHHAFPDATEEEINCVHVPRVYARVFGRERSAQWFRRMGLGAPAPGVGDRSYCK